MRVHDATELIAAPFFAQPHCGRRVDPFHRCRDPAERPWLGREGQQSVSRALGGTGQRPVEFPGSHSEAPPHLDPASAFGLLALFALVAMNAYFVATEFSLVAVRKSQVRIWQSEGRRGAVAAGRALGRLDDAIAATQLGITLASIGLGFLGEPVLARLLEPPLAALGAASGSTVHGAAIALSSPS